MRTMTWAMLALFLAVTAAAAQQQKPKIPEARTRATALSRVKTPPAPYAQWLVDRSVTTHGPVKAVEIAVVLAGVCRTIAATAPEDLGEKCDADENQPMETGAATVEAPSNADPVYDITMALHDAKGNLIGALGMDIEPGSADRADILALARDVLTEVEQQIPSKKRLFQPAP